jgi:putative effector of murein hydrolase
MARAACALVHRRAAGVIRGLVTLLAYQIGLSVYERCGRSPLANPVAMAIALLLLLALGGLDLSYAAYFEGAQFIHFLLGTATVALAVPIYRGWALLRVNAMPALLALACGGAVSIASGGGRSRNLR